MARREEKEKDKPGRPLFVTPPVSDTEIGTTTTESGSPAPGVNETGDLLSTVETTGKDETPIPLARPSDGGPTTTEGQRDYVAGTAESKASITGASDPGAGVADEGEFPQDIARPDPDLISYGNDPRPEHFIDQGEQSSDQ